MGHRNNNMGVIGAQQQIFDNTLSTQEILADALWMWGFWNGFNFARVYLNSFMRYNMTQIFHLLDSKETFGSFCI